VFDVLVDHPKKRFYLLMMLFCCFVIGSIIFDLMFGWQVIGATSFASLVEIVGAHPNSYFGFFFYTLITSPALYSPDVIYLLGQILYGLVISLNFFDWMTVLGIGGLLMSHKNKMSRITLAIQFIYFVLRFIVLLGMVFFLYPAMLANSATVLLSRIHLIAIVLFIIFMVFLIFMVGYLLNILKLFYLPLFEEVDN